MTGGLGAGAEAHLVLSGPVVTLGSRPYTHESVFMEYCGVSREWQCSPKHSSSRVDQVLPLMIRAECNDSIGQAPVSLTGPLEMPWTKVSLYRRSWMFAVVAYSSVYRWSGGRKLPVSLLLEPAAPALNFPM